MGLRASMRFDHQLLAVEREHHVHCMLELVAPPAPASKRLPLHLALVLDRSGSMSGDKLEVAKACAGFLARRMQATDQLAVIGYDDQVTLFAGLKPVAHPEALEAAIRTIYPGGSTNLSGGWLKGAEQLRAIPGGRGPRKVLLLTDGLANVGITDPERLVAFAKQAADDGIGTTTIGFGGDFDEDLLTAMADAGGGNSYFAAGPDEAPGIFAQEFEGLATLVAQNLSVELRPTPEVQVLGVLNDYPQTPVPGGVQVAMGDAYGEERRRLVFELFVPSLERIGVATVAEVVVRYVSVGREIAAHELTLPVNVNLVSADEAAAAGLDAEVTEEVVILKSARAQEDARRRADRGEFDEAKRLLQQAAGELRRIAPDSARAEELLAQAQETEQHAAVMDATEFDPMISKQMKFQSYQRHRGRPRTEHP